VFSTTRKIFKTFAYFIRHLASVWAVQCCTSPDCDSNPLVKIVLGETSEGRMFDSIDWSGGGTGLYNSVPGR
jgi:hypothetical protein